MDKKQQLLDYLEQNLFKPILSAPYTSYQLKEDFLYVQQTIKDFSAQGILYYVWNILANKDIAPLMADRLNDEGFTSYNQILNNFKTEFPYEWLTS